MIKYLTPEVVGLAGQIITFLGVVIAGLVSLRNRRSIQELHVSLNSRLTALLEMTRESAFKAGQLEAADKATTAATAAAAAAAAAVAAEALKKENVK